jgi:hypothetical protein
MPPKIAVKWHPNGRRKILTRCNGLTRLDGTKTTGDVPHTALAAPGEEHKYGRYRNLVFWAHAENEALLVGRDVDKMLEAGMWYGIDGMNILVLIFKGHA